MSTLKLQSDLVRHATGISGQLSGDFELTIDILEPWLARVAIKPDAGFKVENTWMTAPEGDVPWQGRPRLSTEGFSCPDFSTDASASISSDSIQISVIADSLAMQFKYKHTTDWRVVLQDRPVSAYRYLHGRKQLHHAQSRALDAMHLGLGDKAGALDRTGKRFRCLQTDALGYDAETSDPLYKHVPWVIVGNASDGYCGIFYDTLSECVFDLGAEHSNYHEHYRTVEVYENALVYYVVFGPTLEAIVPRFQKLTGMPHLQPRWASGFAYTSMHHADADNAQEVMLDFVEQCQQRSMPISAYHSGSGYTTRDDGRRYVFTWNTKKFPDRDGFFNKLDEAGLYSCANIKPVLLTEHPAFNEVAEFDGFVTGADGRPAIEMFWGGPGASIDFTNPKSVLWWQKGVKEQVLGAGFSATWNDNNECELWDEEAQLNGFGKAMTGMDVRPLQAILMTRASFEAAQELEPDLRPYIITRAGPVGTGRYAQTWSGDNKTSWHTLKWNICNGLSMSLSGFPIVGHDIGGFTGPKPDAELLCRWVEMMALHPRAVMNSWKPEEADPATLPWMHASVEALVRDNLTLRYRFLPWLYHLSWQAHKEGIPVITPMLYYFDDEPCQTELTQFMVGEALLVAPVVESGAIERQVYLPQVEGGWFEWSPLESMDAELLAKLPLHRGGQVISVSAPLGKLPLFVRAGAVLPIASQWNTAKPHDAQLITVFCFIAPDTCQSRQSLFSDDGLSWQYLEEEATLINVEINADTDTVSITANNQWKAQPSVEWHCQPVGVSGRDLQIEWLE